MTEQSSSTAVVSPVVTGRDLMKMVFAEPTFLVEGLFRYGRKRISLVLGQPEDGKSTLVRQLIVCVLQGKPFLGREVLRGAVLFWNCEETLADLQNYFRKLGYNPDTDENFYLIGRMKLQKGQSHIDVIAQVLKDHPEIKLVVIETLDDCLRIPDLKENTESREAFEEFDDKLIGPYSDNCCFIALHHLKKRELDHQGLMILGATVIAGKTDTKLYVRQVSDDDTRRYVFATTRVGRKMPKTYLEFNSTALTSTLGMTLEQERKDKTNDTSGRIESDVIEYMVNHTEGCTREDCLEAVSGNTTKKNNVWKDLDRQKRIRCERKKVTPGAGTLTKLWYLVEIPIDTKPINTVIPITPVAYDIDIQVGEPVREQAAA